MIFPSFAFPPVKDTHTNATTCKSLFSSSPPSTHSSTAPISVSTIFATRFTFAHACRSHPPFVTRYTRHFSDFSDDDDGASFLTISTSCQFCFLSSTQNEFALFTFTVTNALSLSSRNFAWCFRCNSSSDGSPFANINPHIEHVACANDFCPRSKYICLCFVVFVFFFEKGSSSDARGVQRTLHLFSSSSSSAFFSSPTFTASVGCIKHPPFRFLLVNDTADFKGVSFCLTSVVFVAKPSS
mmetsp:Transcript_6064/g.19036  ORF Transcript_6064/g.19036 Transcript_6064/m.19036 type:complete len:241 (+) Transcript_6064:1629-2351(+)